MSLPGQISNLARLPSPSSSAFGDVDGPSSATNNAVAVFNGTTGKIIKNSTTIADATGINGTVGATTPAAGSFTTLTTTGNAGIGTASPDIFARGYGRVLGVSSASNAALEINSATGNLVYIDMGVNGSRTFGISSDASSTDLSTLTGSRPITLSPGGTTTVSASTTGLAVTGTLGASGVATLASGTATPAGGSTSARLLFGTTSGFGIYYGSGAPTVSAAQGSIYLRSDGSSTSTRLYVNTNGTTGWTNFTSAT